MFLISWTILSISFYLSILLCQSESSVSLPYSHSLILGTVLFFPCFFTWSHIYLFSSLSALLPYFSPALLRILFPSHLHFPHPALPAAHFTAKPVSNFVQKMTPHQWPYFAVPPLRVSITLFCHASIAPLHVLALLPFLPLLF